VEEARQRGGVVGELRGEGIKSSFNGETRKRGKMSKKTNRRRVYKYERKLPMQVPVILTLQPQVRLQYFYVHITTVQTCEHHCVQTGYGAHSVSYTMGTRCSFPGSKAAGA
jgi:transposase InsO family protein